MFVSSNGKCLYWPLKPKFANVRSTDSNYAPLTVYLKKQRILFCFPPRSWMSKIRFGFLVPTKTSVTSRENASKRKWMVYPKPTTGARPVQFQQPVPKRKWTGQVALVAWAVFHIVLSLFMVNMHTEIPSARRSASAQLGCCNR